MPCGWFDRLRLNVHRTTGTACLSVADSPIVGVGQASNMNDYEVVTSRTIAGLQDRVRELMSKGLRPLGSVAMVHEEQAGENIPHMVFAQAVVREPAPTKKR